MEKEQILSALESLPTGNIADAMFSLDIPCCNIRGLHPLDPTQPAAAGYAVTVRQMQRHCTSTGKVLTKHSKVIDEIADKNDIIVIDVGGREDVCSGGALLMLRAKLKGVKGIVVNGCLRDVKEISALHFPVYYKGPCPIKSSPALETVSWNEPIEIEGAQIRSGDIIVMDDTGALVIPADRAEEIISKAEMIRKKEARLEALLYEGKTFAQARELSAKDF